MRLFGRPLFFFAVVIFSRVILAPSPVCGSGYLKTEFHELDQDAERLISRSYVVHMPAGYDGRALLPVILMFHGRGGFPGTVARQSQMNALADKHRFMAVYPEGTGQPDGGSFNAGRCCGIAAQKHVDDVGFVRDILDDLERHYRTDPNRIYATGMSNGASMAFRLAAEMPERIAAVGPVSGNQDVDFAAGQKPVPVICFYGMKDPYMSYGVISKSIKGWLKTNHCQPSAVQVITTPDYTMERYEPARGDSGAPVLFYKITEGGHTWPGGVDINKGTGAGPTIPTVSASEILWEFFAAHALH